MSKDEKNMVDIESEGMADEKEKIASRSEEVTASRSEEVTASRSEEVPEGEAGHDSQPDEDELTDGAEDAEYQSDDEMSIIDHLTELRRRLIRCVVAILVGSCITYAFDEKIMQFLLEPAGKLYFMHPGEAFFSYAKVVLFSGFLLATPVVFYEIWRFFVPAFTRRERMVLGIMVPSSILLFYLGLAFSFFLIVPIGIKFFMGMGSDDLSPLFSVEKYLDFIITFLLPFGLAFELPLIIIIMASIGLVTSQQLKKYFRYVFFVSFIIGALLTPPDIVSQVTLALPLTLLYGLSYLVVRYVLRK